jgi:hypothetical protein
MLLDKIEESISKRMKYLVGGSSPAFLVEKRLTKTCTGMQNYWKKTSLRSSTLRVPI